MMDRNGRAFVLCFYAIMCGIFLAAILILNGGRFTYSLDDPYIHLALAENMARGHYGVNLEELSAPSSSILWPLLLTPLIHTPVGEYVPLALNFGGSLVTLGIYLQLLSMVLGEGEGAKSAKLIWLFGIFMVPATGLAALVFMGMEHSLQLLCSVLVVFGIVREQRDGRAPWWLVAAVVCGPLLRYESMALSLPVLVYLGMRGRYGACGVAGVLLAAGLGGFSAFLYGQGLGILPASVLAKGHAVAGGGRLGDVVANFLNNAMFPQGIFMLVMGAVLGRFALDRGRPSGERALAGIAATANVLHVVVGSYEAFARYELYAWSAGLLTTLYVYRGRVVTFVSAKSVATVGVVMGAFLFLACAPYTLATVLTPLASNNIYEQHYQMHRFATEFVKGPVAVNDLGWVAYRNDGYVLDLWGLASQEARIHRERGDDPAWMGDLAVAHGVRVVMVYDEWIPAVPDDWVRLGVLRLGKTRVMPASSEVTFYGVDKDDAGYIRNLVDEFKKTLPRGVVFDVGD